MKRLYGIDLLRFFLAFAVILHHSLHFFPLVTPSMRSFLNIAVDIFFVISGFVIVLSTQSKNSITFIKGRLLRIYPLYLIIFLIAIFYYHYLGTLSEYNIISNLFFYPPPHDVNMFFSGYLMIPPAWTLFYEVFFYFIVAIFLIFRKDKSNTMYFHLIIFFICCSIISLLGFNFSHWRYLGILFNPILSFLTFSCGIYLGTLYLDNKIKTNTKSGILKITCSIIIILFICKATAANLVHRGLLYCVPSFFVVHGAIQIDVKNKKRAEYLGSLSYPMYLGHFVTLYIPYKLIWGKYNIESKLLLLLLIILTFFMTIKFSKFLVKIEKYIVTSINSFNS